MMPVLRPAACVPASIAVSILISGAPACRAAVLTCHDFETRLDQAIHDQTTLDAALKAIGPLAFRFERDVGRGSRMVAVTGAAGFSGRMTCGPDDAFADFYMALDPGSGPLQADAAVTSRLAAIGAASICALTAGGAKACLSLATTMTADAIDQLREDVAQHDSHPQSLQDYDLAEDLDAVFYVTPAAMSWAIGPGLYSQISEDRPVLVPKDRDTDDQ